MFNSRTLKVSLAVMLIAILAAVGYAFAAANTVPDTKAGDGKGTVSGYTVTNVVYTLNTTNPAALDSVSFDLGAAAVQANVQLLSTTGSWYACTEVDATTVWTCDTAGFLIATANQLRVTAASN